MDLKEAGSSMDALISSFNTRILELQELVIARNMYPATTMADLTSVDTTLTAMESQIKSIKDRLQEERAAIPKAKQRLQHMLSHIPSGMVEAVGVRDQYPPGSSPDYDFAYGTPSLKEEPVVLHKEKKVRNSAPRWYVTNDELDSLSSYMRGRLTLDKINIAVNEIATHADANFQLITSHKKLAEDSWEKALELRDIAMGEAVKGKHFFLEIDMKGPGLKLDNTGKSILTVLRHLGRIQGIRIGHHHVMTLTKP